jgi:hypothetical protein
MMQVRFLLNSIDYSNSISPVLRLYPDMPFRSLGHRLMFDQGLDDPAMGKTAA